MADALDGFHPAVRTWLLETFGGPTQAQRLALPVVLRGESTLLIAPTGSGKTLAAFLAAVERVMFTAPTGGTRVVYVSPLKALAADVERNLRAPIAGIRAVASRDGVSPRVPAVAVRTGDTETEERARLRRAPPDVLITTPESLYLVLTSSARESLREVETVIVDEIHTLVGTKRGAHLWLSLERLEALRKPGAAPLQRVGLSATARPLDEVARALGGCAPARPESDFAREGGREGGAVWAPRPVTIVDAGVQRSLDVRIEVPVEDMAALGTFDEDALPSGPAAQGPPRRSIWPSMHPRLVELVRAHRSTMVFVNSRRLAERLASAINDEAGEELACAHHGSLARERRSEVEDRLKRGELRCIVATSSLELGLDLGAVDLVVQVEAPPTVAAGLQRVGRAGHHAGGVARGVFFPKFRADLLASVAVVERMRAGEVEHTFYPRNPLDVLAQQVVAIVAMEPITVDSLHSLVRGAAPFAELSRGALEGVLEMLTGAAAEVDLGLLRPRLTWDRRTDLLSPRRGARRLAVVNAGTIPDRGLYGVFLAGGAADRRPRRVGELDEEMVFESREGDVIVLGASSWRIEEITHDRVLVSPAPGEVGKMPFWHGDRPGRSRELGRAVGALARALAAQPAARAEEALRKQGLDARAARNLVAYVHEQRAATGEVPSDRTVVIERFRDELGDFRVCVLTPFGARVHAPWAMAVQAALRDRHSVEADPVWSDDGFVLRLPDADEELPLDALLPDPDTVEEELARILGGTALFAARFREAAGRALLLPRRMPGKRTPLWAQRRRAADLLSAVARQPSFPLVLETMRECLRDVLDVEGLRELLGEVRSGAVAVRRVESERPSPFASSILFSYVANFIYEGDAPLAERRAQALSVDTDRLRELLGEADLRALLDPEAAEALERKLQWLDVAHRPRDLDGLHDLLLALGDLSREEIGARAEPGAWQEDALRALCDARRVVVVRVGGVPRFIAAEDAGRFRDAAGVSPPPGLPDAFLRAEPDALERLLLRYARTHLPFAAEEPARRWGLGVSLVRAALRRLVAAGRLTEGAFLPGSTAHEYADPDVLRALRRGSLARLRRQVEAVPGEALARLLIQRHGIDRPRAGLDAVLDAVARLQGAPLVASTVDRDVMPARVADYTPGMLDAVIAAGEVVWVGLGALGPTDGRIALYLADDLPLLAPEPTAAEGETCARVRACLLRRGASFFGEIARDVGGFPGDVLRALWDLVWAGELTNDTLTPLRARSCGAALVGAGADAPAGMIRSWRRGAGEPFRSRRVVPPGAEGRWSLLPAARARALGDGAPVRGMLGGDKPEDGAEPPSEGASAAAARDARAANDVERRAALARALLARYGVLTREAVRAEGHAGGFGAVYDVLRAMEDAGRVRRGYFVEGLGAAQFAEPGADDALRALREPPPEPATVVLAATDPASPYGAALPWPGVTSPATTTARAPCSHDAGIGGETEADGDTTPWEERSARAGTAREEVLADTPRRTARVAGAHVVLHGGRLVAYLSRGAEGTAAGATGRGGRAMLTFLPLDEIAAARIARAVAQALAAQAYAGRWRALTIATVDGIPVAGLSVGGARSRPASIDGHGALEAGGLRAPRSHAAAASARTMVDALLATGFVQTRGGLLLRAPRRHSATA